MRRIALLIAVVALFAFQANAQIKLGLDVGANITNFKYDYKDADNPDTKPLIAPRVGIAVDLKVPGPIGIGTGLYYSGKGFATDLDKTYDDADKVDGSQKTNVGYLELPVHIKYNIAILHVYAGPYLAMGIMGKQKNDYTIEYPQPQAAEEGKDDLDIEFTDKAESDFDYAKKIPMKGMDLGLDFGVGVKLSKLGVHAGYSMGLANITPDMEQTLVDPITGTSSTTEISGDDLKAKTSAIQFGVIYYF